MGTIILIVLLVKAKKEETNNYISFKRVIKGSLTFSSAISVDGTIENIFIKNNDSILFQLIDKPKLYKVNDLKVKIEKTISNIPLILLDLNIGTSTYSFFDAKKNIISEINFSGNIISEYKISNSVGRCIFLDRNTILAKISNEGYTNDKWAIVDTKNHITWLEDPLMKYKNGSLINDGFFFRSEKEIFYVNYYMNDIVKYSKGNLRRFSTIDKGILPPKLAKNGMFVMIDKSVKIRNIDATAKDEFIYILSNSYSKNEREIISENFRYLDVYSSDNCTYLYSIKIPPYKNKKAFLVRKITGGFLFAQGSNIVKYFY